MREFNIYQNLPGDAMDARDHQQVGSKFWGLGKWDNFVTPHLPKDCGGLSLADIGCNAGLFLKFAQDRGFNRIIGVDSNKDAVARGRKWARDNGGKYKILRARIENCIHALPIVDYTLLCNSHYYYGIVDWLGYLDKLQLKTHRVILVTTDKRHINKCWARADVESIRYYFRFWKEVSFVDELPTVGDPDPRRLWSLCFESPLIEKIELGKLEFHNHVQDSFYKELDEGKDYHLTGYYRILKKYRVNWSPEYLDKWVEDKIKIYEDLKKNGQFSPILINRESSILDGNHRGRMMQHLGYKLAFGRRT